MYSIIFQAAPGTNSNNYYVSGWYFNSSSTLSYKNSLIMKMSSDDSILWSAGFNLYVQHPFNPMTLDENEQSIYFYGSEGSGMIVLNLNASSGTVINQK